MQHQERDPVWEWSGEEWERRGGRGEKAGGGRGWKQIYLFEFGNHSLRKQEFQLSDFVRLTPSREGTVSKVPAWEMACYLNSKDSSHYSSLLPFRTAVNVNVIPGVEAAMFGPYNHEAQWKMWLSRNTDPGQCLLSNGLLYEGRTAYITWRHLKKTRKTHC